MISNASRWSVRKKRPISAGLPNAALDLGLVGEEVARFEPDHDDDLDEERGRRDDGGGRDPGRAPGERGVRAPAEVGDHEEEHHHHGARVDEHLRRRDELRRGEQEEDGERGQVADQRERREEGVANETTAIAEPRQRRGRDEPDRPDEDVAHQELDL